MKFLADMGISPRVVTALRKQGHDAVHLREQDLGRLSDHEILAKSRVEGRILLTHDLDFGELLAASGGTLPSVMIFRLKDMRAENVSRHLFAILSQKQQTEALSNGAVCSITERKVRIRVLPL
jgi:predicted nuclease of predicted toxin-antitoxin system